MVKRNLASAFAMEGTSRSKKARGSNRVLSSKKAVSKIARQAVLKMAEKKVNVVELNEVSIDTFIPGGATAVVDHTAIPSGGLAWQRIGREVRCTGISLKGVLYNTAADTKYVRHLVLMVKDGSADITGATGELFEKASLATAPMQEFAMGGYILGLLRKVNQAKFTVLHDSVIRLGASADPTGAGTKYYNKYINLKDARILYENALTGGANQNKRLIQIMFTTRPDNDEVAANFVEWSQHSQLTFTDL